MPRQVRGVGGMVGLRRRRAGRPGSGLWKEGGRRAQVAAGRVLQGFRAERRRNGRHASGRGGEGAGLRVPWCGLACALRPLCARMSEGVACVLGVVRQGVPPRPARTHVMSVGAGREQHWQCSCSSARVQRLGGGGRLVSACPRPPGWLAGWLARVCMPPLGVFRSIHMHEVFPKRMPATGAISRHHSPLVKGRAGGMTHLVATCVGWMHAIYPTLFAHTKRPAGCACTFWRRLACIDCKAGPAPCAASVVGGCPAAGGRRHRIFPAGDCFWGRVWWWWGGGGGVAAAADGRGQRLGGQACARVWYYTCVWSEFVCVRACVRARSPPARMISFLLPCAAPNCRLPVGKPHGVCSSGAHPVAGGGGGGARALSCDGPPPALAKGQHQSCCARRPPGYRAALLGRCLV